MTIPTNLPDNLTPEQLDVMRRRNPKLLEQLLAQAKQARSKAGTTAPATPGVDALPTLPGNPGPGTATATAKKTDAEYFAERLTDGYAPDPGEAAFQKRKAANDAAIAAIGERIAAERAAATDSEHTSGQAAGLREAHNIIFGGPQEAALRAQAARHSARADADASKGDHASAAHFRGRAEGIHSVLAHPVTQAPVTAAASPSGGVMTSPSDCVDCDQHEYGPTGKSVTDAPWNGAASRFTDEQYRMASAACDSTDNTTVKQACHLPHHEPGGAINRNGVHAAAGRFNQTQMSPDTKAMAKAHLRSHYTADLKEDPPDALAAAAWQEENNTVTCPTCHGTGKIRGGKITCPTCHGTGKVAAESASRDDDEAFGGHGPVSGQHTHAHNAYGTQGTDQTHEHLHSHASGRTHNHHSTEHEVMPAGVLSFISQSGDGGYRDRFDMMGAAWAVCQNGDRWQVLVASGQVWEHNPAGTIEADGVSWNPPGYESYTEAVAAIGNEMQSRPRPVTLDTRWRSDSAYEGRATGDGRRISEGAIEYRNCPLPLMLQTQNQGGHMGAVLAGTIEKTGKVGEIAKTEGTYDSSDAGRQAEQIVAARGKFGVSIDVAEAEGAMECPEGEEPGLADLLGLGGKCEMVFSLIRVMGLTMTPFPAFEDAYIENVPVVDTGQGQAASVIFSNDASVTRDSFWDARPPAAGVRDPVPATSSLLAAGGPARPPGEWFEDPGFGGPSDHRMVRQPDGQFLCPLTVTPEGRVYGHFAGWQTCHTGYQNACTRPPRSRSGYAAFMLRPIETAEGDIVHVGHISMGCGHIPDDGRVPLDTVRAHYDGGPGAVLMARVRCGDDSYGGWFAGALCDGVSDIQVRKFRSMSVSGHWREVWRGKGLDLLAITSVPVPGFPVSAMAAAGYELATAEPLAPETQVAFDDGRVVALVAAGIVRQPMPWERTMAEAEERIVARLDEMETRLMAAERITAPLRREAAARMRASSLAEATKARAERLVASGAEVNGNGNETKSDDD